MARPAGWDQRFLPMVTVVPYVALAVMAALTIALKHDRPGSLAVDLVLCAAAAVWSLALFTLHPQWRDRSGVMGVFLSGLIVFGLVMVLRDPWFGVYTPVLYFYAYRIIGWPRELYFIAGVAVVAGTAQSAGVDTGSWAGRLEYLGILVVNIAPMCLLAWIGEIGGRYYDGREAALREAREANTRLAAALAENAALQERLVEQARAAGVLDERARMAREIHDTLAQGLTGIVTQLQAAEHAADDPAAWRRHHAAATALARESLTEARRSVNELRPEPLETGRLADAVTEVAAGWSARHGVPAQVTVTGEPRTLRPEAEVALFRVAQEALANVAKHACPVTRVGLTLSYMDRQVALDVRDDGRGFDPAARAERDGGFGLVAMRQRIEALSGTLQIESEPGHGTGISACLPAGAPEVRP
ncbi:sensor histidine kinase [Microbispora sp. SCL1-1]|jgi:signal transduction histidine kinase|uniref:Oxygen sensor histidine kinase NreB n=1 Tax=Microbispora hainanensis TaxID=568844 RepID=A0ABZ1T163_9ACTN|nr:MULTISPECIES: sensor histidine kinase [Microbispora]NJP24963.1 sensor histidine kinase [Microbispora sp. CL1-1]TQS14409.1 sensor histidine kinase [Microbispora sp. SCL1-1]